MIKETAKIYSLINPINGLVCYIGKTELSLEERLRHHINESNSKKSKNSIKLRWIQSLYSKKSKIKIKLIDEVPYCDWQFWEKHYIKMFKACGAKLYNGTDGGDGGFNFSKEAKERMSLAQLEKKQSPERAEKSRQALQKARLISPHPFLGKKQSLETRKKRADKIRGIKRSEETKLKMSLWQIGRKLSQESKNKMKESAKKFRKPILQFDKNGIFVKEWESATLVPNINKSNILTCCRGKKKSAGNYIWKFKN